MLYISHLHPPVGAPLQSVGGMQKVSMQLSSELEQHPEIELKSIIQHAPWKGIEIRTAFFLLRLRFQLPGIVRSFRPDVILFSSMVTASLAAMLRDKIDVPMVTINHGQDVTMPVGIYQRYLPKVFGALDGVISVSRATRQQCINRGMSGDKGVALPNGFDMEEYAEIPHREEARKALEAHFGIDLSSTNLLLTVGRQVKRKGHAWFLEKVLPRLKSPVIHLLIGDGPEHERIKEVVKENGVADKVLIAGKQPDLILKQAYSAADLFVMPNIPVEGDMEGFGIVLLEANMASTAAVASDLEGIKDVITNGENGYRVPPEDEDAFLEKVEFILSNKPADAGARAEAYVREKFSWNRVAEQYILYLGKVVEQFRAGNS